MFQTHNIAAIDTMPDDVAGKLFKAILHWADDGFDQCLPVPEAAIATFAVIKDEILDAKGHWFEVCEQNAKNARSGWEKRRPKDKAKKELEAMRNNAAAYDGMQTQADECKAMRSDANHADKDKDRDKSYFLFLNTQGEDDSFSIPEVGVFRDDIVRQMWSQWVSIREAKGWSNSPADLKKHAEKLQELSDGNIQTAKEILDHVIKKPYGGIFRPVSRKAGVVQNPFADVPEDWDQIGGSR